MYEHESDQRLMERVAGGDAQALDAVVARHQHRVQRFAARMLSGDTASAADVATGAFLRLWEARAAYRPTGRVESWLLKTAYRLCLDHLAGRSRCAEAGLEDDLEDRRLEPASDQIERSSLAEAVREAITELPEAHRAVVILTVYEELSYEAVAEALAIPLGTVASRKNQAVALLRQRLAAW